jgi:hypothetical protein
MRYLKVSNVGTCPKEAFTMLGISTARGQSDKIGCFGSGSKMAIGVFLRNNISPVIVSGDMYVTFSVENKKMGDQPYGAIIANINGVNHELGFALEFGAIDWTKISMGVREVVSNAIDQGDYKFEVVDEVSRTEEGRTAVYIPYTDEVKNYHENLSKYFLTLNNEDFVIGNNPHGNLLVYRKGVLVSEDTRYKALFRYNINSLKVDESRNVDTYTAHYFISINFHKINEYQAAIFLEAIVEDEEYFECGMDFCYIRTYENNFVEKIQSAWAQKYSGYVVTSESLAPYLGNKYARVKIVKDKYYKYLKEWGVPVAEFDSGTYGAQQGFMPIPVTTDCKRMFNRVWKKLEKMGLTNGKPQPILKMFAKPMGSGCTIGGYQEGDSVYIDRNHVNAKVLIEEIGHYVTDASDCTRDFQDWAFSVSGCLI